MRTINWKKKGHRGKIYDCRIKVDDESKIIVWIDCSCWNFVNIRIIKYGQFSDIKYYAEPCKHLLPVVSALEKQGYILKRPKPMVGTDKCTTELRRFLIERSGGMCEVDGCKNKGEDVHRKIPRTNLGKYNKDNCVLLCKTHHRAITYQRWQNSPGAKK